MKKGKILTAIALAAVLSVSSAAPVAVSAATQTESSARAGKQQRKRIGWQKNKTCYYDENGKMVKNKVCKIGNKLYCFDKKGRKVTNKACYKLKKKYYSINKKGVATLLSEVERLAVQRAQKCKGDLRKAFEWCAKISYRPVTRPSSDAAEYYGKIGLKRQQGDCNVAAYTFYWLAKSMGYKNVKYMEGYVQQGDGTYGEHAWCEIKQGKKTYIYDPNFANQYAVRSNKFSMDHCYKFRYGAKNTYKYLNENKVEIRKK